MTVAVYKLPPTHLRSHDCLIAHLRETSPDEAIAKLSRAGVLAIHGRERDSIILLGYHHEIRRLLRWFRSPCHDLEAAAALGKIRRLASMP